MKIFGKKIKKETIVSLFIVFLMVISAFGVMLGGFGVGGTQKLRYNDYKFVTSDYRTYQLVYEETPLYFNYFPGDLENMTFPTPTPIP